MKVSSLDEFDGDGNLELVARTITDALKQLDDVPDIRAIVLVYEPATNKARVGLGNYGSTIEAVYDAERLPKAIMGGD